MTLETALTNCRQEKAVLSIGGMLGSIFDATYVRPLLENSVSFLRFQAETGDQINFEQFHRAFTACVKEQYGYEFQVRDALSAIPLYAKSKSKISPNPTIPSHQETRLKEILLWIDKNYAGNISVAEIAGTVNICPREYLSAIQETEQT